MRILITLALTIFVSSAQAQDWQWSRHFGGEGNDYAVVDFVDAVGNAYVHAKYAAQATLDPAYGCYFDGDTLVGSSDAFIVRYDENGSITWLREVSSPQSVVVRAMVLGADGDAFYAIGSYTGSISLDTVSLTSPYAGSYLSKWNLDGHCLWARNILTDGQSLFNNTGALTSIVRTGGSNLVVGGTFSNYGPTQLLGMTRTAGSFLAAFDADGDSLWTRTLCRKLRATALCEPLGLAERDGDLYVALRLGGQYTIDTVLIDTTVITNVTGVGLTCLSMRLSDRGINWITPGGFEASANFGGVRPYPLLLDANDVLHVVGNYSAGAPVYGTDTLPNSANGNAFHVRYDTDGLCLGAKFFSSEDGAGLAQVIERPDGLLQVIGSTEGDATWDGIPVSSGTGRHMVLITMQPDGQVLNASAISQAYGLSLLLSPTGIYATGSIDGLAGALTVGDTTYTSYGFQDAVVMKHDLMTSIHSMEPLAEEGLRIFANPNQGSFRLMLPTGFSLADDLLVRVYDATGRLVKEQALRTAEERPRMDVFDVGAGYYMVTLSNGRRTCAGGLVVE